MRLTFNIFLNVILPIVIGVFIYTLFRSMTIRIFTFYEYIGIAKIVTYIRSGFSEYIFYIPKWIIYSLPDGLWVYSLTSMLILIWKREILKNNFIILIILSIMCFYEIIQSTKFIDGTFDVFDLLLMIFGTILSYFINTKIKIKNEKKQ